MSEHHDSKLKKINKGNVEDSVREFIIKKRMHVDYTLTLL